MATDQEIRDAGILYMPKQKYLQNPYNLPIAPVPPPASGGITNIASPRTINNGGNNNFKIAGNMFGQGTAVRPGDSTVLTEGPFRGQSGYYDSVNYSGGLPGNITQKGPGRQFTGDEAMVGDPKNFSKKSFDNLESEEEKKGFLSKMMNSFKQKTTNLPDWAKAGITAAGMLNPLTAIPSLISKFGGEGGGGPSYGIAGLTDRQKNMYNTLASNNMLFNDNGIYKTYDGKNFGGKSSFGEESIKDFYDNKIDRFGSIEEYRDYLDEGGIKKDPKNVKNLLKTLQMYDLANKSDNKFTDFNSITNTDPTITSDLVDEFVTTNNDGSGYTGPPTKDYDPNVRTTGPSYGPHQDNNDNDNDNDPGPQNDNSPGSEGPGGSDEMGSFAKGGRAGYFFGGRVNYKQGGRVSFKNGGLASIL